VFLFLHQLKKRLTRHLQEDRGFTHHNGSVEIRHKVKDSK
jgi:hypothetical protein